MAGSKFSSLRFSCLSLAEICSPAFRDLQGECLNCIWDAATSCSSRRISQKRSSAPAAKRQRMDWSTRVDSFIHRGFKRRYRLSKQQFDDLLSLLRPELEVACAKTHSYAVVPPELQLSMTLHFLAGGSYLDIVDLHGVAESTFYKCIWRVILLIKRNIALGQSLKFPSESEFPCLAAGPACLIFLQPHEVPNPRAYYCRKGYFGINAQLACGPDLRFRWADVRCTGGTHDQLAYTVSGLDILKGLPPKYYCVGDNGYLPHEYLLVPYKGRSLRTTAPYKDSFNFHLSQLRIHVERAFGMLTARWGILWKPVSASLAGTLSILKSCFRLHNFCIDSSGSFSSAETISQLALPRVADEYGRLINDFEVENMLTINPATSSRNPLCFRREAIVQALHAREILRPHTASERRQSKRWRLENDVE
eukprot:g26203.t1